MAIKVLAFLAIRTSTHSLEGETVAIQQILGGFVLRPRRREQAMEPHGPKGMLDHALKHLAGVALAPVVGIQQVPQATLAMPPIDDEANFTDDLPT